MFEIKIKKGFSVLFIVCLFSLVVAKTSIAVDFFYPDLVIVNGVEYKYEWGKIFPINLGDNRLKVRFLLRHNEAYNVDYELWSGQLEIKNFEKGVCISKREAGQSKLKRMDKLYYCEFILSAKEAGEFKVEIIHQKTGSKQDRWNPLNFYVRH